LAVDALIAIDSARGDSGGRCLRAITDRSAAGHYGRTWPPRLAVMWGCCPRIQGVSSGSWYC